MARTSLYLIDPHQDWQGTAPTANVVVMRMEMMVMMEMMVVMVVVVVVRMLMISIT